jgi:hypothetical protein
MDRAERRNACRVVKDGVASFDKSAWSHMRKTVRTIDTSRVHVRSYRHDQPMPMGFSMGATVRIVGV